MSITIDDNQISPCIAAKAKYALGVTSKLPTNNKTCSDTYWLKVVHYLADSHELGPERIQKALDRTDLYKI